MATIKMTNSEVEIRIANAESTLAILIPVNDGRKKVIQSVKCKSKDKIALLLLQGDADAAQKLIDKTVNGYRELVEDRLKAAFPGIHLFYTERNELLKFEGRERVWIELNKPETDETEEIEEES